MPEIGGAGGARTSFIPVDRKAISLTVGTSTTTAAVALPACSAQSLRIVNDGTVKVHYRLGASNVAAVIPTTYTTAGTGGAVGDPGIPPSAAEVFGLTDAQQVLLAAGTLYIAAIASAAGTITITPGTGI